MLFFLSGVMHAQTQMIIPAARSTLFVHLIEDQMPTLFKRITSSVYRAQFDSVNEIVFRVHPSVSSPDILNCEISTVVSEMCRYMPQLKCLNLGLVKSSDFFIFEPLIETVHTIDQLAISADEKGRFMPESSFHNLSRVKKLTVLTPPERGIAQFDLAKQVVPELTEIGHLNVRTRKKEFTKDSLKSLFDVVSQKPQIHSLNVNIKDVEQLPKSAFKTPVPRSLSSFVVNGRELL